MTPSSFGRCFPWIAAAVSLLASPALADQQARLTVELKVRGTEQVRGAGQSAEHAEGRFDDSYRIGVTLTSSGEPGNVNIKDPEFAAKMMAQAQEIQAMVQAMQAGKAPPATADVDEEDDYRYLDFFAGDDCADEIHVVIDRALSGEYADVQGMVPYSLRSTADYRGNDLERQLTCLGASLVLDVKAQVFYTDAIGMPEAQGREVREVKGRAAQASDSRLSLHGEISLWVAQQLRKAPVSGQQRATIELAQNRSGAMSTGDYRGQAEVELSWRLEPVR